MATSNVVISEGQVTFKRTGGHNHDGLTSTLIDTSKYSIFDFVVAENALDSKRRQSQGNRKEMLKSFIISTVEERVLKPTGILIQANTISAREIISGTITANELSSNIVLVDNVIRSKNYINNTTTFTGWAIYSNGEANFNNVNIRGNLKTGNGFYGQANTPLYADNIGQFSLGNKFIWNTTANSLTINAGSLTLGSNLTWDGNTLTVKGQLLFPDNTSPQSQNATDGFIGGIDINGSEIQSNSFVAGSDGFRISANGDAEFNDVTVRGTIYAGGGEIGDWIVDGSNLRSTVAANGGQSQFLSLDPDGGIYSENFVGGSWGSGYFTQVKINYGSLGSGIDIYGNADGGNLNTTELRSAFVSSKYITATTQLRSDGSVGVGTTINESQNTSVGAYGVYIDNSGFLTATRAGLCLVLNQTTTGTASQQVAEFRRRGSQPGTSGIFVSSTAVAYATTSDYRLKKDVSPIEDGTSLVKILNPVSFNRINHENFNKTYGFLAHELQEVIPDAVMNEKDGVDEDGNPKYQSVDVSFTVPIIVSALKEAIAKIEGLEARIQVLEGV